MDNLQLIRITINGEPRELAVDCRRTLADVLRHDAGLTGTRLGCEHGICGACTVLVDGEPTRACLVLGVQLDDGVVETVEGLAEDLVGARVQAEFRRHRAYQCGFCTSGFLMLATWLARRSPPPDEDELRDALASNLCRCTGYAPILDATRAALEPEAS
jgi:aerobic-type carbon monoxide dehydrogenase small subunit (CoxS/CutS family)